MCQQNFQSKSIKYDRSEMGMLILKIFEKIPNKLAQNFQYLFSSVLK